MKKKCAACNAILPDSERCDCGQQGLAELRQLEELPNGKKMLELYWSVGDDFRWLIHTALRATPDELRSIVDVLKQKTSEGNADD